MSFLIFRREFDHLTEHIGQSGRDADRNGNKLGFWDAPAFTEESTASRSSSTQHGV